MFLKRLDEVNVLIFFLRKETEVLYDIHLDDISVRDELLTKRIIILLYTLKRINLFT